MGSIQFGSRGAQQSTRYMTDLDSYRTELLLRLQDIRNRALEHTKMEQERVKRYYGERNRVKVEQFYVGERVLVHISAELTKTRHPKFAHKYVGPYRISRLTANSAVVQLIGETANFQSAARSLAKSPAGSA